MGDLVRACAEHPMAAFNMAVVITFWMALLYAQFKNCILRVHIFQTLIPEIKTEEEEPRG